MSSGEIIEKSFLGFPGQLFLQLCFRANFTESIYVVNMETASKMFHPPWIVAPQTAIKG